jgi:hypothetical protein
VSWIQLIIEPCIMRYSVETCRADSAHQSEVLMALRSSEMAKENQNASYFQ